jgi:hypothetical protein
VEADAEVVRDGERGGGDEGGRRRRGRDGHGALGRVWGSGFWRDARSVGRVLGEMEAEQEGVVVGGGRGQARRGALGASGKREGGERWWWRSHVGRARRMRPSDLGLGDWAVVRSWAPRGLEDCVESFEASS